MLVDMVTNEGSPLTFSGIIARARVGCYMKQRVAFHGHVKCYEDLTAKGIDAGQSLDKINDAFSNFCTHCNGFNGTLGPSDDHARDVINDNVEQQQLFFLRHMGGITGCKVTADHHDNIAGRTKVKDDTVKQKF